MIVEARLGILAILKRTAPGMNNYKPVSLSGQEAYLL